MDLILLRGLLPDVPLRPGSLVTGRVLDARTLILEGVRMQAQLPPDVQPGQRFRMRVESAGQDRLHLRVIEQLAEAGGPARASATDQAQAPAQDAAQAAVQTYAMALPGGIEARVYVTEDGDDLEAADGAGRPIVLRYDSPSLGRLDIRLDRLSAAVHAPVGEPAEHIRGALDELKAALERVQRHEVQVTLHPRPQTYDARA